MAKDGDQPGADEPSTEEAVSNPDDIFQKMDPFEPYTTGELANILDIPKQLARKFLNALTDKEKVRKKEQTDQTLWVREPPTNKCTDCGYKFQVKFLHPVFSSVQLCPRCGTKVE